MGKEPFLGVNKERSNKENYHIRARGRDRAQVSRVKNSRRFKQLKEAFIGNFTGMEPYIIIKLNR